MTSFRSLFIYIDPELFSTLLLVLLVFELSVLGLYYGEEKYFSQLFFLFYISLWSIKSYLFNSVLINIGIDSTKVQAVNA